jgi:hypothetical protein
VNSGHRGDGGVAHPGSFATGSQAYDAAEAVATKGHAMEIIKNNNAFDRQLVICDDGLVDAPTLGQTRMKMQGLRPVLVAMFRWIFPGSIMRSSCTH